MQYPLATSIFSDHTSVFGISCQVAESNDGRHSDKALRRYTRDDQTRIMGSEHSFMSCQDKIWPDSSN